MNGGGCRWMRNKSTYFTSITAKGDYLMSFSSIRLKFLALSALAMTAGTVHGATDYQLQSITFQTSSVPNSTFAFGVGGLAASLCYTCGPAGSHLIDDGAGNLTVNTVSYLLSGFGANFTHTFSGTATLGTTSLLKGPGETCVAHNAATHLCNPADQRSWAGNWYNGLLADGVTLAPTHQFSAVASGNSLVLRVRTNRDATPFDDADWLQMNFNYQVVPVPAAVWLFGSAIGVLGFARRRSIAARA